MSIPDVAINGEAIRALRIERQWSREQLAVADGRSTKTIENWEGSRSAPPPRSIAAICEAFDVGPDAFMTLTDAGRLNMAIEEGDAEEAASLAREMARGRGVPILDPSRIPRRPGRPRKLARREAVESLFEISLSVTQQDRTRYPFLLAARG